MANRDFFRRLGLADEVAAPTLAKLRQPKTLRRLQHQLAARYHLRSYSVGREPHRRVRFLPSPGR